MTSFGKAGRGVVIALAVIAVACSGKLAEGPGDGGDAGAGSSSGGGSGGGSGGSSSGIGGSSSGSGGGSSGSSSSSGGSTDGSTTTSAYDGTVGKACASNADCKGPHGPGVAVCSSTVFTGGYGPYYPTAVCILQTCNVGNGQSAHYCDGPDAPSSPGICVPSGGGTMSQGICLPQCQFKPDGQAPGGCAGKDVCNAYTFGTDPSGQSVGYGYCFGGCAADGDCPTGAVCQLDTGLCVKSKQTRTKTIGAACTATDYNNGVCACDYGASNSGFCSSFCRVGGSTCPSGYVCDGYELTSAGFAKGNPGLGGQCVPSCSAGQTCPASSQCSSLYAAGPDCQPQ